MPLPGRLPRPPLLLGLPVPNEPERLLPLEGRPALSMRASALRRGARAEDGIMPELPEPEPGLAIGSSFESLPGVRGVLLAEPPREEAESRGVAFGVWSRGMSANCTASRSTANRGGCSRVVAAKARE